MLVPGLITVLFYIAGLCGEMALLSAAEACLQTAVALQEPPDVKLHFLLRCCTSVMHNAHAHLLSTRLSLLPCSNTRPMSTRSCGWTSTRCLLQHTAAEFATQHAPMSQSRIYMSAAPPPLITPLQVPLQTLDTVDVQGPAHTKAIGAAVGTVSGEASGAFEINHPGAL